MQWVISLHFWHTLPTQWEWIIFNLKVYYFHSVWRSIKSPLSLDSIANSIAAVAFKHRNNNATRPPENPTSTKSQKHIILSTHWIGWRETKCRKHLILVFHWENSKFFPWLGKPCHFSLFFPSHSSCLGILGIPPHMRHICSIGHFNASTAQPAPQGLVDVLAAPCHHLGVVATGLFPPSPAQSQQTSTYGRDWLRKGYSWI